MKEQKGCSSSADAKWWQRRSDLEIKWLEATISFPFLLHFMACVTIVYSSKSQKVRLTSVPVPGRQNIND